MVTKTVQILTNEINNKLYALYVLHGVIVVLIEGLRFRVPCLAVA